MMTSLLTLCFFVLVNRISGAVGEDGQTPAVDDSAIRGPGEEEVHGGRGLQGRPQTPQTETERRGDAAP